MGRNILILAGTAEASALARALARLGAAATLSFAGRVAQVKPQPVPVRIGGFGGPAGLAAYLRQQGITHLVDATHPFAARVSWNAVEAAQLAGVPLIALARPPWTPGQGDRWIPVPDVAAAAAALDGPPRRIFLAIGRQELAAFAAQPSHFYLLRLVDPPAAPFPFPRCHAVIDRGPFTLEGDLRLLAEHAIDLVVSKNSGGEGARSKLLAARQLGIPVVMIERPPSPPRLEASDVAGVLRWLGYPARLGV